MKPVATACLLCLSSMVFIYPCCAQTSSLDSLSAALKTAKEDTNKVRLLKRIVFVWSDTNLDSAKIYLDEMKSLSAKLDFPEGIIYADVKLGEIYNVNGNFEKATEVNNANLAYASEKGTPYQRADVYKTIAMTYSMQLRNDSALSYYLKALNVYDDHSDSLNMAKVMTNIAVVHDNMGDHKKSIEFCKRSKEIFKGKDRNAYLVTLSNLALYEAYDRQYDAAKANYTEALQMAEAERNYNSLAHIYSGLMDVVYWKKQYPEMIGYASKFEEVAAAMQSDYIILRAKLAMGKALFFNKKFNESQAYFNEALKLSDQLEDDELLKDVYGMYSYLTLSRNGNVEEFDLYRQKIDSLTGLENKNTVTRATKELEARYQSEKKDNQIKLQSATIHEKQIWNYLFISVIAALCSIGFISFRGYRNKQKLLLQEKTLQQQQILQLEKEKQLAATQAVLQGQDEERGRLAKDLHDGLGGMLSGVKFSFTSLKENMVMTTDDQQAFARNMDMLDGTIQELRRVAQNMMPESLIKFGLSAALQDLCNYVQQTGALKVDYQNLGFTELSIDKNISIHIYRIVQELLNNILKHAKATRAVVQVVYDRGHFSITVEDDGKGFNTANFNQPPKHNGMGWLNVQNRVTSLEGKMDVRSSPESGTSIFIEFNV